MDSTSETPSTGVPEPQHTNDDAPDWARGVGRLVVLSGAGISTDSGIPDFRGPSGVWTMNPGALHKHTYEAFLADAALRGRYWASRYEHPVWRAEPNAAHLAVASLADSDIDTTVVTQNTDGLHQRAGTPADRVIELHGTMHDTICVQCGHRSATAEVLSRIAAGAATPPCVHCGGILKTASTMFGQTMSPAVFARASRAVAACELVLAVGTTLTIEPAGSLCASAVHAGARLVVVNRGDTPYDGIATELIREPLGEALPRVVRHLRAAAALAVPATTTRTSDSPPVPRPSLLLRAAARTARFRSVDELARLTAWCAGAGVRTHLVSGPAGLGKTRLALELADRLTATGDWDVEFLGPDAALPASARPLLVVVDDAETRREQVVRIVRAARESEPAAPIRVLLLARTRGNWSEVDSSAESAPPDVRSWRADAVRDYAEALAAMGFPRVAAGPAGHVDPPDLPGELQSSVLADLLGGSGHARDVLVRHELAHLRRAAWEHGLRVPPEAIDGAVVTAVLCGAVDEDAALAALGHLPALRDPAVRRHVARWLRDQYPPAARPAYWADSLPDVLAEDLVATVVTPGFLMGMLMETTAEQDRRALTVLARAADTRPALRVCLTELLSVLPGVSPAAVGAAVGGGHPGPLADALTALAGNAALPEELLAAVPPGTTVLGEFPVLLAESLVEAYEQRAETYPESGLRGLAGTLAELAGRLADLGRAEQARAAAHRAVAVAERLAEPLELPARAAESLRRARELARPSGERER
jgi:NAD-dependent deacetylase